VANLSVEEMAAPEAAADARVSARERATLLAVVLIISICALVYELLIATLTSYLVGDSVTQFSVTIGLFLFAMGIGALLSRRVRGNELRWFIVVELLTGFFGGISAAVLYATYTTINSYYLPVMLMVIMSIGICVGLEIPLLTRIVANRADLSKALADILSIDYLGALVGSLLFPIVLLPLLGVTQTAFVIGLLNVVVGLLCLRLFHTRLDRLWRRRLYLASGGLIAILLTGVVFSTDIVRLFEQNLYQDVIIYRQQSPFQRVILTRDGEDVRMFIDGNLQFSSRDEYRYHEVLVHPLLSLAPNAESVLVLGGGDGFVARELLKYPHIKQITVVDLDPAITNLAKTHPLLRQYTKDAMNDPRVQVINMDAYKYIEQGHNGQKPALPLVIIDLPDPNNEGLSKLYSQQFYKLLLRRMPADGAFVTQAASPYFVREAFWMIANTIESAGFQVTPLHAYVPSFGDWGFVIGTPQARLPFSLPGNLSLRYLTPDVLAATLVFDNDIAWVETGINTLDNPILPRVYLSAWARWD
jgi:spermidine synthase